jgi:hypothetical protein
LAGHPGGSSLRLTILKHQDDAFVDELIKELREGTDELEKDVSPV